MKNERKMKERKKEGKDKRKAKQKKKPSLAQIVREEGRQVLFQKRGKVLFEIDFFLNFE